MSFFNKKKKQKQKIYDTPHKNKFNTMSLMPCLDSRRQENVVLTNVKEKKGVIVGSSAFNSQMPFTIYQKHPKTDIDVVVPKPKNFALKTEQQLDNMVGMNNYYVSELEHDQGKTYRVHSRAKGNQVIVDASKPKKVPFTTIGGVRYETLAHREQAIKKMIADPNAQYRRKKDERMLGYINRYKRSRKYLK